MWHFSVLLVVEDGFTFHVVVHRPTVRHGGGHGRCILCCCCVVVGTGTGCRLRPFSVSYCRS